MIDKIKYQTDPYKSHFDFWAKRLQRYPASFSFLQHRRMEQQQSSTRRSFSIQLADALGDTIISLAKANDTAIYSLLFSAFGILLKRYTHQSDIIIETPPLQSEARGKATDCATIPVAFEVPGSLTLRAYLNQVISLLKDSYRYGDFPLSVINEDACFKSNILFAYAGLHAPAPSDAHDMVLTCRVTGKAIAVHFSFNPHAYSNEFVERLSDHFQQVLEHFGDLGVGVADIGILDHTEKARVLNFGCGTPLEYDRKLLIPQLVEKQCARCPDGIAVVCNNQPLTYKELSERSSKVSAYLRQQANVQRGDRVGIYMERSDMAVVSMLAVLKAGAAYVPLDINTPKDRLAGMIEDAGMSVLIIESKDLFDFGNFNGQLLAVDLQLDALTDEGVAGDDDLSPGDLAYVIYTSGSSGASKGVLVGHEAILNTIQWRLSLYAFTSDDKVLQIPSMAFDSSVEDIFCALIAGATLVIPSEEDRKDVVALGDLITKHAVTHFLVTPSFYDVLLDELAAKATNLRVVTVAGEAVTDNLVMKHFRTLREVRLLNEYGPTENAVCTTVGELFSDRAVSIGKPIDNINVYILDTDMQAVPTGVAGEICIGGRGLSSGYLNNPVLTAERFPVHTVDAGLSQRLYRSGDLACWLEDGNIDYLGRKDSQVKLNGIRVELRDIESTIHRFAGIQECKVILGRDKVLKAAVKIDKEREHTLSQLMRHVGRAPDFLSNLTRFPNGLAVRYKNMAETNLLYHEIFRDQLYMKHGIGVPDNAVVFDVGANIGMFSLFVGLNFRTAKIYSFEPLAPIYETLSENLSLYPVNARAYNIGFSDVAGTAEFFYYYNNTASSGMYADIETEKSLGKSVLRNRYADSGLGDSDIDVLTEEGMKYEKYRCELDTLDNFIEREGIEQIDLLKLDVEKSEIDILSSLQPPAWRKIRQIVAEVHDINGGLAQVEDVLRKNNFMFYVEQPDFLSDTEIYYVYARQKNAPPAEASTAFIGRHECSTDPDAFVAGLRQFCERTLPAFMIPATIRIVDEIPLTINGKTDSGKLLAMLEEAELVQQPSREPRTHLESTLVSIWRQVIGKDAIGVHDNFFQIGGDSIKAIQIASRMHKEGYKVEVKDIFENQTIENLAANARPLTRKSDQSMVAGEVPLTPIQQSMFPLQKPAPHHFNQSLMLFSKSPLQKEMIEESFLVLLKHHDALRMTLAPGAGAWTQYNQPADRLHFRVTEFFFDTTAELTEKANELQTSINLEKGPLVKVALFHLPDGDRLLIIIHHMVVDGVSWRIILEDLGTLSQQFLKGEKFELPEKTDSFKEWSETLHTLARTGALKGEEPYWNEVVTGAVEPIPLARNGAGSKLKEIVFTLTREETALLLEKANVPYNTRINDLLLAAMGPALNNTFGVRKTAVLLEGHGRENVVSDIDVTRTVGWFTSVFPVVVSATSSDWGRQIVETRDTLRGIPNNGIGYGILRELAASPELVNFPEPKIIFNYLGQFDADIQASTFTVSGESSGDAMSAEDSAPQALSFLSMVADKQLSVTLTCDEHAVDPADASFLLAQYKWCLQQILSHCGTLSPEERPAALTVSGISMDSMNKIKSLFN